MYLNTTNVKHIKEVLTILQKKSIDYYGCKYGVVSKFVQDHSPLKASRYSINKTLMFLEGTGLIIKERSGDKGPFLYSISTAGIKCLNVYGDDLTYDGVCKFIDSYQEELLHPFKSEEVYVWIESIEEATREDYKSRDDNLQRNEPFFGWEIKVSLATYAMAKADYYFFANDTSPADDMTPEDRQLLRDLYRPYYYAFSGYISSEKHELLDLLKHEKKSDSDLPLIAQLAESGEGKTTDKTIEGYVEFINSFRWDKPVKMQLTFKIDRSNTGAASAFERSKERYRFPIMEPQCLSYAIACKKTGQALDRIIKSNTDNKINVDIYNVGQASFTAVYSKEQKKMLFDFGLPDNTGSTSGFYNATIIKALDRSVVMTLSHWHSDHYKAALLISLEKYSTMTWITAGLCNAKSRNARRFAAFLEYYYRNCARGNRGDFLYLGYDYKRILIQTDRLIVCKGKGKEVNSGGILLQIDNSLLTGDCMYKWWPDLFPRKNATIKHVIVPHHCGILQAGDKEAFCNKIKSKSTSNTCFYISVGANNKYNHPDHAHLKMLEDYKKMITRDCKKPINEIAFSFFTKQD